MLFVKRSFLVSEMTSGNAVQAGDLIRRVLAVPSSLPVSWTTRVKRFWVREEFWIVGGMLLENLNSLNLMTVVSTPGVGTSIFYIYCYYFFRAMRSDAILITAAFDDGDPTRLYTLYYPGSSEGVVVEELPQFGSEEFVIHLYDGVPPEIANNSNHRTIAFVAVETHWVRAVGSLKEHGFFSMKPWKLHELLQANETLGLGISNEEIEARFEKLGGVVRYCLGSESQLTNAQDWIGFSMLELVNSPQEFESTTPWIDLAGLVVQMVPFMLFLDWSRQGYEWALGSGDIRSRLMRIISLFPPEREGILLCKFAPFPTLPNLGWNQL